MEAVTINQVTKTDRWQIGDRLTAPYLGTGLVCRFSDDGRYLVRFDGGVNVWGSQLALKSLGYRRLQGLA